MDSSIRCPQTADDRPLAEQPPLRWSLELLVGTRLLLRSYANLLSANMLLSHAGIDGGLRNDMFSRNS